jgi:ABC-type multidrug transport system fused ATPase/permease subunit
MNRQKKTISEKKYTGINRLLKSEAVQSVYNRLDDGTFREFLEDWKWIFSYSKKYRGAIVLYTLTGIISTTFGLGAAVLTKYMIDVIVNKKVDQLWLMALLMVGSTLFSVLFSAVVNRMSAKISIDVNNDIRADIFGKVMDSEWLALNEYASGDLLNRFSNDIRSVASNAVNWLPDLIIQVYGFVASFLVICYYDVTMALIALLSAPFLLLTGRYILRKMKRYRKKVLEVNSGLMGFEAETFYNVDTIKSFGITKHYEEKLESWQKKFADANLEYNAFSIKSNAYMTGLTSMVSFVAFGYCLLRLWTGSISYGTMTLFLQQRSKLSSNFDALVKILPNMVSSGVAAHRVREISELPKEGHSPELKTLIEKQKTRGLAISLNNITFSYRKEHPVLKDSSFLASPGEIVALVGPSGEGKTTMLRLILGLVSPDRGEALMITEDGERLNLSADLRSLFAYVPQGNTLLSGTIAENLRLVKKEATEEEIVEALKIACAWEFVQKMEGGIHGKLGERGRGVSEGQAQRIAIARAILRDAPILLLDEATSALDVETERKVLKKIMKQRPNKTCIVSTHRPSVLGLCQRVYRVMNQSVTELDEKQWGRLVEDF